jgi:hypothetical protein
MIAKEVEKLIAAGRVHYLRLLEEAKDLLRHFDTYNAEELAEAVRRRGNIVGMLQDIDERLDLAFPGGDDSIAEFRTIQERTVTKILEIDGLVIALARERQAAIKNELASLSKSRTVLEAYEKRTTRRFRLDDTV